MLKPLPKERFVYGEWETARVNIDYHIEVDHHYYSAPHALVHEHIDARVTATTVEMFFNNRRPSRLPRVTDEEVCKLIIHARPPITSHGLRFGRRMHCTSVSRK